MEYIQYFLKITLYPVAAVAVCGYIVWVCRNLFLKLLGHGGYAAVLTTSIIGTPIHELGHAIMCLLFGHKIRKLVLWQPHDADGTMGYVLHSYDPGRLYPRLGNLFIGAGPIYSGMAVLCLLLHFFLPNTWNSCITSVRFLAEHSADVPAVISVGADMISRMIEELGSGAVSVWLRILLVLVMLSVSMHISLSPEDIKGGISAIPVYLMVTLAVTVITCLIGPAAVGAVLAALETFHAFMMTMFTVVLVFAAVQVALAMLICCLLSLIGK